MKLKRRVIESKYRPQIDAMYAQPSGGHAVDPEYAARRGLEE
jgi:hypothetical protein